ncbi:MAG TPA: DNA polymerase III subunit gamma/tau [Methylomirabilota bacterium]|nr:DNA polymerase III subunit gamma/tau [Methylomirabilota bacterium]
MAPRALTLKYRPQVFADLVGQEHVTAVLTAALESGRVAQAFLFTGARGVGKTTSARLLAKALNCQNRKAGAEPCGTCTSCTEIAAGVSLDVLEIDGASNRGIADVQQLRENVRFAPTGGRHRVVIIDEVHQLSSDAFAALLKTLEEPPAHLVFIFATTDPQKLPDTIRSRTQRFDFARVPIRRVADRLLEIQKREAADADGVKFKLTDGAALLIAHKGEGSLRDAVSGLDQVVSAGEEAIDEALVRRVLGIPDREAYFLVASAVFARDPKAALEQLHAAFEKGLDPRELAEGLSEHFRNVLVLKVDPERGHDLVAASNEDLARLKKQGEGEADTDLLRLMRLATDCQWPMRESPQPLVHLEAAVLQMATLEPAESVAALIARLEALEKRLAGGGTAAAGGATPRAPATAGTRTHGFAAPGPVALPAPARVTAPAAPPARVTPAAVPSSFTPPRASEPESTLRSAPTATRPASFSAPAASATTAIAEDVTLDEGTANAWRQTIARVNERKRMLGAFLEEIQLVGVAGDALVLAMDDLHRSVIDSSEHRPIVHEELARAFGRPVVFRCTAGQPVTPAQRAAQADSLKPMIERAMEVFDGEVIDRAGRGGERTT